MKTNGKLTRLLSLVLSAVLVLMAGFSSAVASEEDSAYTLGDIDSDTKIIASDALMALQYSVNKIQLSDSQMLAADVDADASINATDALYILQYAVEKIESFEEISVFSVYPPEGEVYPYTDKVAEYLKAGEDVNMMDYVTGSSDYVAAIPFYWSLKNPSSVTGLTLEYSTQEDFSEAITVTLDPTVGTYGLYNLYKNSTYFWRMTATLNGNELVRTGSFTTNQTGPRAMWVDGLYNVRDAGGYTTIFDGKVTRQGLVYRGGGTWKDSIFPHELTDDGKKYMSEVMNIQLELDVRNITTLTDPPMESVIPGAKLEYVGTEGYQAAFTQKANYKKIFQLLADESNYPVYIHCTGGKDRTGTVLYLLNALLGVEQADLIKDYELSSFTCYGQTNINHIMAVYNGLQAYQGDTLAEKTESYMRFTLGLTQEEVDSIRTIMIEGYEPSAE